MPLNKIQKGGFMKNIFTKFLGLPLVACALAVSCMVGCGSSSSTTTTEDAATATDNNASRALETEALTITTTIPAN